MSQASNIPEDVHIESQEIQETKQEVTEKRYESNKQVHTQRYSKDRGSDFSENRHESSERFQENYETEERKKTDFTSKQYRRGRGREYNENFRRDRNTESNQMFRNAERQMSHGRNFMPSESGQSEANEFKSFDNVRPETSEARPSTSDNAPRHSSYGYQNQRSNYSHRDNHNRNNQRPGSRGGYRNNDRRNDDRTSRGSHRGYNYQKPHTQYSQDNVDYQDRWSGSENTADSGEKIYNENRSQRNHRNNRGYGGRYQDTDHKNYARTSRDSQSYHDKRSNTQYSQDSVSNDEGWSGVGHDNSTPKTSKACNVSYDHSNQETSWEEEITSSVAPSSSLNVNAIDFVPKSSQQGLPDQVSNIKISDDTCKAVGTTSCFDSTDDTPRVPLASKEESISVSEETLQNVGDTQSDASTIANDSIYAETSAVSSVSSKTSLDSRYRKPTSERSQARSSLSSEDRSREENKAFKGGKMWGDANITRQNKDIFDRLEKIDEEYKEYMAVKSTIMYNKVKEIEKDLFEMDKDYALAHCVAEDMRMGSGIAVTFKQMFKKLDELLSQKQKPGGLAFIEDEKNKRFVYYLVTKHRSSEKPTYETMWSSLQKLRDHVSEHKVKKLAIPRLGCGLDRLEWRDVKNMIEFIFRNVDVNIVVCNFQQPEEASPKPLSMPTKLVHVEKSIAEMEHYTILLYFSTEDGHVAEDMELLDKKFNYLRRFKQETKKVGTVVKYEDKARHFILYGCIVRKSMKDDFDFKGFTSCIRDINKQNKKDAYEYVAFQVFNDKKDEILNDKIITLLRNYMRGVDIYVCWYGELAANMPKPKDNAP